MHSNIRCALALMLLAGGLHLTLGWVCSAWPAGIGVLLIAGFGYFVGVEDTLNKRRQGP